MFLNPLTNSLCISRMHINFAVGHRHNDISFLIPHNKALITLLVPTSNCLQTILYQLFIRPVQYSVFPEIPTHLESSLSMQYFSTEYRFEFILI